MKFLAWNSKSLARSRFELLDLLDQLDINICLISETWLKPSKNISFPGFSIYRHDRTDRPGGGVAILVRSNIEHHQVKVPSSVKNIDAVAVNFSFRGSAVTLISCYLPPGKSALVGDFRTLLTLSHSVVLAGDFNAKHTNWGCNSVNSYGKKLFDMSLRHTFDIITPDSHTYFPTNTRMSPSIIDFACIRNLPFTCTAEVVEALDSDHLPVLYNLLGDLVAPQSVECYRYDKADWGAFGNHVNRHVSVHTKNIETIVEIDDELSKFTELVNDSMLRHIPKCSPRSIDIRLPEYILDLIKERNVLRSSYSKYHCPFDKRRINELRKIISEKVSSHRTSLWTRKICSLNPHDSSLWRMARCFTKRLPHIPPLVHTRGLAQSPAEKADCLASTLEAIFIPRSSPGNSAAQKMVNEVITSLDSNSLNEEDIRPTSQDLESINHSFLRRVISKFKGLKAPGPDTIPNIVLKHLPLSALELLVIIFRSCLILGYFPSNWKTAKTIVLPKKGKDLSNPKSYRPIGLLNTLSKLLEKVILLFLNRIILKDSLIRDEQFGFRSCHSAQHQLVRLTEHIIHGFNFRQSTGVVFLDIEKAFDTVWHDGLITKLRNSGFPVFLIRIIRSYLSNRSFYVAVEKKDSSVKQIRAGVPQGSILGPVLFNLFINDLPNSPGVTVGIYADDTILYSSSRSVKLLESKLQESLRLLGDWLVEWKLGVNVSKTEAVLFTKRNANPTKQLIIFNQDVSWSSSVKYLGIILDRGLAWTKHINYIRNKFLNIIRLLSPILNCKSLNLQNAKILFLSIIRPILTYAPAVWCTASPSNHRRVLALQSRALRRVTRAPWFVRNSALRKDLDVPELDSLLHNQIHSFFQDASKSKNPIIVNIGNYISNPDNKYLRPRDKFPPTHPLNKNPTLPS